jgi:hypothetical protein
MTGEWTTILAMYAAVVSSAGLVWNIYSWYRARSTVLRGTVTPNTLVMSDHPFASNQLISVSVSNHGSMTCTVETVNIFVYDSWLAAKWGGPTGVLGSVELQSSEMTKMILPCKLESGARYQGFIRQPKDFEKLAREKYLYVVVRHSLNRKRGYRMRLRALKE